MKMKKILILLFNALFWAVIAGPVFAAVVTALLVIASFWGIPKNSLATGDFATQLIRDWQRTHATLDIRKGQQRFELERTVNDIGTMNAYYRDREITLQPEDITAIEGVRTGNQAVELFLWQIRNPGAGTVRVRTGSGATDVATVTPTYFAGIEEGIDMSAVNQMLRAFRSEGADKKIVFSEAQRNYLDINLWQVFRNIYTRANVQFNALLDTDRWALTGTPDEGTIYTTVLGDEKLVPVAGTSDEDFIQIFQNIQTEARQNNFLRFGRPNVIASPTTMRIINAYLARGRENAVNVDQFLDYFTPQFDNLIVDSVPNGDIATFYFVASGGLAGYSRSFPWASHMDAVNGVVTAGEDSWSNMPIGGEDTMIFNGLPEINLEVKTRRNFADNSGVLPGAPAEATIDIASAWSFFVQFGGLRAFDNDPNVSPILKYVVRP